MYIHETVADTVSLSPFPRKGHKQPFIALRLFGLFMGWIIMKSTNTKRHTRSRFHIPMCADPETQEWDSGIPNLVRLI